MIKGRKAITKDNFKQYLKRHIIDASRENFENTMKYNYSKNIYIALDELAEDIERIFYNRYLQACSRDSLKYYSIYQYIVDNLLYYNKIFIVREYIKIDQTTFAPRIILYYKKT